jgi:polyphosphate glucokinase
MSDPLGHFLGVDVGGSGVEGADVDVATGAAIGRRRVETPQPATPDAVADAIADVIGRFEIPGPIGCTMPAVVLDGVVKSAAHIDPSWIGVDAPELFSAKLGRPCVVVNDADAAGVAEARFGAARGEHGLVALVTIGTGVGTALINHGVLVANSELGHIEIEGHVADDWVSDAARSNEELSWKKWSRRFDQYLTTLHSLVWPTMIVVGGGVVKHRDRFLEHLDPGCEVRIAELGNLAGIVGAAALAAVSSAAKE